MRRNRKYRHDKKEMPKKKMEVWEVWDTQGTGTPFTVNFESEEQQILNAIQKVSKQAVKDAQDFVDSKEFKDQKKQVLDDIMEFDFTDVKTEGIKEGIECTEPTFFNKAIEECRKSLHKGMVDTIMSGTPTTLKKPINSSETMSITRSGPVTGSEIIQNINGDWVNKPTNPEDDCC